MKNEDLYPKPMTEKEFFELAKNRNKYKVLKQLTGDLKYAKIGDTYFSDTLYERGYNMYALVEDGTLELVPRVFDFEKEIVGKNVHPVYTLCSECRSWGINMPLEKQCGNCGYTEGKTYYDAETINSYLKSILEKQPESEQAPVDERKENIKLQRVIGLLEGIKDGMQYDNCDIVGCRGVIQESIDSLISLSAPVSKMQDASEKIKLSDITDEDANYLMSMIGFDELPTPYRSGKEFIIHLFSTDIPTHKIHAHWIIRTYFYLQSKNYELPKYY